MNENKKPLPDGLNVVMNYIHTTPEEMNNTNQTEQVNEECQNTED